MMKLSPEEIELLAKGEINPELEKKLKLLKALWKQEMEKAKREELEKMEKSR